MAIVLRIPKRQVRLALVVAVVATLGAGVAAQTTSLPASPAPETPAIVPHATGVSPVATARPERPAAVAVEASLPEPGASAVAVEAQDPPGVGEGEAQQPGQQTGSGQAPPDPQQPQQQPPPVTGGAGQATLTPEEREALDLANRLIREQEGVLMGVGFDYDARGRRDPFRSLLVDLGAVSAPSVRPPGLPGYLISEVELKAIAAVQGRWHAMVIAPDQRAYFLEVGTELFDGHVVQIGPAEVTFEQIVPDLTGARRSRQVTKRLRTTDGGGETPQ